MKKRYIICFLSLALFAYACYIISYSLTVKGYKDEIKETAENLSQNISSSVANSEQRITTVTTYTEEIYNQSTGELTYTTRSVPITYVGLNKQEFIEKIHAENITENILKIELLTFTPSEVAIRKTIAYEITAMYYLKIINETLVIYEKDQVTVYDYADIDISNLPENLQEELKTGIYLENDEELYEFLQNYSS